MTRKIAITGLPGAGKSTIARLFGELGAAVFDADAVVRDLYASGGAAARPVLRRWPEAGDGKGGVSAAKLRELLLENPAMFNELEAIVHPLVAAARADFLQAAHEQGVPLVVLEIPLLFETGADAEVDIVLLADASDEVRLARLRQRPGFDERLLRLMEARQLPIEEKRQRAHHVIDTGKPLADTREEVARLYEQLARQ